jgi:hypothetical protein
VKADDEIAEIGNGTHKPVVIDVSRFKPRQFENRSPAYRAGGADAPMHSRISRLPMDTTIDLKLDGV